RLFLKQFTRDAAFAIFPATGGRGGAFTAYVESESEIARIFEAQVDPALKRRMPDLQKDKITQDGLTYYKYSSAQFPPRVSPCYFVSNHHLIIGNSEEAMASLARVSNGKVNPLKKNALFQEAKLDLGYRRGILFFLNAQKGLEIVHASAPPAMQKMWPVLLKITGIDAVRFFTYSVTVKDQGFREIGLLSVAPERKGLLKVYMDQPVQKLTTLNSIPSSARVVSAGTLADFAKMWDEVNSQMSAVLSKDEYEKYKQGMDMLRNIFNFDIRRDLLEPIGNQFAFSYEPADPSASDPSRMKYLLVLNLRKPDQFRQTIERLVSLGSLRGLKADHENYKGKDIVSLETGLPQVNLTPCYIIDGSWFTFSTHVDLLKKSIDTTPAGSIASFADYKQLTSNFPGEVNGLSYTNVQAYLEMYATMLKRQADSEENRWITEMGVQEELESLAKNLFGSASYMQMRKEGVYVETYASLPSSVLALPVLMTLYPSIARRYPHTD
ncbi:MAG TPA: DUF3352 domain-containing protein, partial [Acidobacteriota bacterium]|nr:DUF3352 domain-containing protein [Acidobacteriota bacterium]